MIGFKLRNFACFRAKSWPWMTKSSQFFAHFWPEVHYFCPLFMAQWGGFFIFSLARQWSYWRVISFCSMRLPNFRRVTMTNGSSLLGLCDFALVQLQCVRLSHPLTFRQMFTGDFFLTLALATEMYKSPTTRAKKTGDAWEKKFSSKCHLSCCLQIFLFAPSEKKYTEFLMSPSTKIDEFFKVTFL